MHEQARRACENAARHLLETSEVDENGEWMMPAKDALDSFGRVALKYVDQWARQADVYAIGFGAVFAATAAHQKEGRKGPTSLVNYLGEENAAKVVSEIVDTLVRMPMRYVAYFPLPRLRSLHFAELLIGGGVSLVQGGAADSPTHAVDTASVSEGRSESWFLSVEGEGFYRSSVPGTASAEVLAKAKQALGLGYALQVFARDPFVVLPPPDTAQVRNTTTAADEPALRLPQSFANMLNATGLVRGRGKGLGAFRPNESRKERLAEATSPLSKCLNDSARCSDILTAAEWYFDALAEPNQTLSYLYAAIGLEAVLDSPSEDVTRTLGDRLAYLVGRTRSERSALRDQFTRFYRHRSKIVHGKRARLAREEVELLEWGRLQLQQCLAREISFLDDD